jgi:hypothetical protein
MSLWENSGEFINEMFCVVAIVENLLMVQARALSKYTPPILASIDAYSIAVFCLPEFN